MTPEERALLLGTAKQVVELHSDRDDMLIGFVAVMLDVYRALFEADTDTKHAALIRLRAQEQQLNDNLDGRGTKALKWLADSLETGKLDAAHLFRMPPTGSA